MARGGLKKKDLKKNALKKSKSPSNRYCSDVNGNCFVLVCSREVSLCLFAVHSGGGALTTGHSVLPPSRGGRWGYNIGWANGQQAVGWGAL